MSFNLNGEKVLEKVSIVLLSTFLLLSKFDWFFEGWLRWSHPSEFVIEMFYNLNRQWKIADMQLGNWFCCCCHFFSREGSALRGAYFVAWQWGVWQVKELRSRQLTLALPSSPDVDPKVLHWRCLWDGKQALRRLFPNSYIWGQEEVPR